MHVTMLPEIYVSIFSFIPEKEQENLPLVCKTWHELLIHKFREKIKHYANKILNSESIKFEEQQIDSIVSLLLNSYLLNSPMISPLKQIRSGGGFPNGSASMSTHRSFIHKKTNSLIHARFSCAQVSTDYFKVIWNAGNLKLEINTKGKKGDFSNECHLVTWNNRYHMSPPFTCTLKQIDIAGSFPDFFINEQVGGFHWSFVDKKNTIPKDMSDLIQGALNVKLQAYIERLIQLNLTALACFSNLQDFENLKCLCNERGVITQAKETPFSFSLKVIKFPRGQDKTIELLDWTTTDDVSTEVHPLKDVLRWTVISATADEVAKKFGIQLELKKGK